MLSVPERYRTTTDFIPKTRYMDPGFLQLELDKLFPFTWLIACREEELFDVGSFVEFSIGDQSFLVVKESTTSIRAYYNACRHRGMRLLSGRGRVGDIRCPFHGWRYSLDGSIKLIVDEEDFAPRPGEDLALVQVQVGRWGGWVFINMDPEAEPLLSYLDPIPQSLEPLHLENMRYKWLKRTILPCNWKTAIDAFIEGYHVPGTHPQLVRDDKSNSNPLSQRELERRAFSPTETFRTHSRFSSRPARAATDSTTRRYARSADASSDDRARVADYVQYMVRELRALHTERDAQAAEELRTAVLAEGVSAPARYMQLRKEHARADGLDWPDLTGEQWDAIGSDWHIFPNTVILPTQGSVLGYRSRPHGLDPDSCVFEAYCIEQIPVAEYSAKHQFAPEFFADWRTADVGGVLEQDFANLKEATLGMHSRSFPGYRLNLVQETTIHNEHVVADRYLWKER